MLKFNAKTKQCIKFNYDFYALLVLILSQAIFRDGDAHFHLLVAAKNFKRYNVTHAHVEHHINDVILTGDFSGVAVYGCAY